MIQLEFDLWVEERISLDQQLSQLPNVGVFNDAWHRAMIHSQAETTVYHDPVSLATVVRYRI